MSEWITDRRPTEDDADYEKCVWTMCAGAAVLWGYGGIRDGQPWMPTNRPKPYVKPKRWTVRFSRSVKSWVVDDRSEIRTILFGLDRDDDEHREAAERIAAIYEEVMP